MLTLHLDTPPDGQDARIRYTSVHTLDGSGTTVPGQFEDVLATGASAFAAIEYSAYATDRLNTGATVARDYAAWGRAWMTVFRESLRRQGRERSLRSRRLFTPA